MNDFEKPLLVNACAGSGKTTIVILMILVAISKGLVDSSEVLGVTFSNRSRLDMDKRYDKYIKELSDVGLNMRDTQPLFSTFHALF
ncbi:UvrD-helicase domain-containing protein, partial [Companilactobacillus farciminis]